MKNFFLLALLVWMSIDAYAQNTFERWYDTLGVGGAQCVQQTFDGGYILCATRISISTGSDGVVLKLDSAGNITWAKVYGGPGQEGLNHIEQTPDSGYIAYGAFDGGSWNSKGWLLRLNNNGDTLWTKTFSVDTQRTEPFHMGLNSDSGYTATGYVWPITGYSNAFLYKTNVAGSFSWSKKFSENVKTAGYCVRETYDTGYIIAGTKFVNGVPDVYLIRTKPNTQGDTLWTRTFGGSGNDQGKWVEQTNDSGFIVAGYAWNTTYSKDNVYLFKATDTGDTLWTRKLGSALSSGAYCVQQTYDGGFIITGRVVTGVTPNSNLWLLKTDLNGDTIWSRQYGGTKAEDGYFVRQTKDSGFIVCGNTGSFSTNQNYAVYLIKTDSFGNVNYTGTGINEVMCHEPELLVYPNPCDGKFGVNIANCHLNKSNLEIYNLMGEKVYSVLDWNEHSTAISNFEFTVNIADQPGGIYLIRLQTNSATFSKKIIINH